MKTTFKQIAAGTFIAFIVLAGNVKTNATEFKASSLETTETVLQMENWMTDRTVWNTNSFYTLDLEGATESTLEFENWMISSIAWNSSYSVSIETETEMNLESWMTSSYIWNTEETYKESTLLVENWMVNSEIWK